MTDTADGTSRSTGESLVTVLVALVANVLIAIAKSAVALVTGSASMVAEAAHSWADAGNEVFLVVAERRAARPSDAAHPYGYGREAYVWSMFAAFGLFSAGAVVSIWHGIQSWREGVGSEAEVDYRWAYAVLALAFVLEGASFLQARRQTQTEARRLGLKALPFIVRTSNPTLRAVFFEDAAALVGIVLASIGIALHQVTGDARWDAVGSIAVGLLLLAIAVFLIGRNRDFLVGQAVAPAIRQRALHNLLEDPEVERLTFLHLEFVGPGRILLIAAVDLVGDDSESRLAERLHRLSDSIKEHDQIEDAIITLARPADASLRLDPQQQSD
ncbi:MAG: cation diffusion facilitator family transporter [Knoellia sp.]